MQYKLDVKGPIMRAKKIVYLRIILSPQNKRVGEKKSLKQQYSLN